MQGWTHPETMTTGQNLNESEVLPAEGQNHAGPREDLCCLPEDYAIMKAMEYNS